MAKQAIFLQNILWESGSKFYFKQCSLKKFLKILILKGKYMETCFYGNQHSWAIKHPFINLYSKYHCLKFICLPVMNSPVFPNLDNIFCNVCTTSGRQRSVFNFTTVHYWDFWLVRREAWRQLVLQISEQSHQ